MIFRRSIMKLKLSYNAIFFVLFFFSLVFLIVSNSESKNLVPGEEEYLLNIEKIPSPVGGLGAIMKRISYPQAAQKTKTEGKVYVLIYINETGDVDEVKLVKGIGMGCDDEAINAIKKTKFEPGMDKGVAVKSKMSLALTFKL